MRLPQGGSAAETRAGDRSPTGGRNGPVRDPDLREGLTVAPTQPRRGLVLVRVFGEVDMLTVRHLGDVLDGAVATVAADRDTGQDATPSDEPAAVVCDLGGVTFLSAAGLDVLVTAQATARDRQVRLVLVAGHRTVVRPLRLTALDRRLTLTDTHPALGPRVASPEGGR